jgi:enoyl-CoA hydratase/carnithine racemase
VTDVERERRGALQILRINRPEAGNSLTPSARAELGSGIEDAEASPEVRAIILTGTGERSFCTGMDLRGFASGENQRNDERAGSTAYLRFSREGSTKPVIAAVNGSALAGGFELLLSCELAVASTEARFGVPEVKRGLLPAGGGVFLGRRVPLAVALEMTLTGDTIDAERALTLGLVNQVVPPGDVLDAAVMLADRVVANGPLAVSAIKRLVHAAIALPAAEVWALQDELLPSVFGSADAREGAAAFLEKRAPVWEGR